LVNALTNGRTFQDWPNRFWPLAIESLAELQNGCYRLRWEAVPGEGFQILASREYLEYQAHLMPGSYILGWTFTGDAGTEIQITDIGMNGSKFFNGPTPLGMLLAPSLTSPTLVNSDFDQLPLIPYLLPKKRLVIDPGKYAFQFWNIDPVPVSIQFVLWLAEPTR